MVAALDSGLDFFRSVLQLRGYRQQILAADLANASTPGFKAVDLDFPQALAAALRSPAGSSGKPRTWLVDDARDLPAPTRTQPRAAAMVKYQTGSPVTLDGNSVDIHREKLTAAENGVQYMAAATFAAQFVRMLTTAVGAPGSTTNGG